MKFHLIGRKNYLLATFAASLLGTADILNFPLPAWPSIPYPSPNPLPTIKEKQNEINSTISNTEKCFKRKVKKKEYLLYRD